MSTISIDSLPEFNMLKMIWQEPVKDNDVRQAFIIINDKLKYAKQPMVVMVILPDSLQMPVTTTILGALPVYRNENLREWVVVGSSQLGQVVERILTSISRRSNVSWHKTEAEAMEYLQTK